MGASKANQQKWDLLIQQLNDKFYEWVGAIVPELPNKLYKVEQSGNLYEGYDLKPYYAYSFNIYSNTKGVRIKDLELLAENINKGVEFTTDKLSFEYKYLWDAGYGPATTGIRFNDFMDMKPPYFIEKSLAETYSNEIKECRRTEKEFDELHKKDKNYNYRENGYKDLGWQNSWHHVYFDEDGKQTTGDISKGEKPSKTFGYTKEQYPEYATCRELKHRTVEVSHNNRGTQHDVSCPECKIVWHYDSSD